MPPNSPAHRNLHRKSAQHDVICVRIECISRPAAHHHQNKSNTSRTHWVLHPNHVEYFKCLQKPEQPPPSNTYRGWIRARVPSPNQNTTSPHNNTVTTGSYPAESLDPDSYFGSARPLSVTASAWWHRQPQYAPAWTRAAAYPWYPLGVSDLSPEQRSQQPSRPLAEPLALLPFPFSHFRA